MKLNRLFIFLISLISFHSCTVQKCVYRRGWNIDFHSACRQNESALTSRHPLELGQPNVTINSATVPFKAAQDDAEIHEPQITIHESSVNSTMDELKSIISEKHFDEKIEKGESKKSKNLMSLIFKSISHVSNVNASPLVPDWLLLLLCFFLPPIAVFIMTNGNLEKVLISLLLWILGIAPGIVYAFLVYLHIL